MKTRIGSLFFALIASATHIVAAQEKEGPLYSHAAYSRDGRVIYYSDKAGNNDIYILFPGSRSQPLNITKSLHDDRWPSSWSPDGNYVGFSSNRTGNWDIFLFNSKDNTIRNITDHPAREGVLFWSPDGAKVGFHSTRSGSFQIYTMNLDGSELKNLTNTGSDEYLGDWSPNGELIAFSSMRDQQGTGRVSEIYVMNKDGTNQRRLTRDNNFYYAPAWSPDGSKIAFAGTVDGNQDIYILDFKDSSKGKLRLTNHAKQDLWPRWLVDGEQIAFSSNRSGVFDIFVIDLSDNSIRKIMQEQ